MKRKLPWACAILVVLGLAVRGPSESSSPAGAAKAALDRSGPSVECKRAPDPLPKATPSEGTSGAREHLDVLRMERTSEEQAELKERQVRARPEADRIRARQRQVAAQQERIFEEHRARLIEAGFDPDLPGPSRAPTGR